MAAMRVGILGLGSIGLRHAKNVLWLKEHEVFGFDPSEDQQLIFASYGGIPASREAVMACDKIIVASPTVNHWQDLRDLADVGKPTLAEKPIADRPIDFDVSFVKLVGYNLRYHSCVKQAKQWLNSNIIGKPLHGEFVLAQYNDRPQYMRDGVALNWSHEIDLALHLLGKGECLASACKNNTIADFFVQHINGAVSSIHLNYVNKREERYFTILGDKGRIHCTIAPYRCADCFTEDGEVFTYNFNTTFDEDYIAEIKSFLGGDIGPGCTADQAKDVLKICIGT